MNFVIKIAAPLALLALAACGGGSGSDSPPPAGGGGNTPPPVTATAPTITTQPLAQGVTAPDVATFSVVASGTAPLAYRWRSSTNGTDWTDIAGATGASYATGATEVGMNGRYYSVVVSNSAGSVVSGSVQLTAIAATSPPTGGGDPGGGGSSGGGGSGSGSGSGGGGGGSGGGGGGGSGPIGPSIEFPHTANPIAVAVTPASDVVANFSTTSSSDTLVRTPDWASDIVVDNGVTASFGFRGDTFLEDQSLAVKRVTLTGLDSAHPLPFQSVVGTFALGSADTDVGDVQTNNLVRVTITLTQSALDALGGQPVIFSARSDGTDLHIVPVFSDDNRAWSTLSLTTRVDHLGIFGIATLSDEQAATLAAAWPSDDDIQLEAAVAPASYELRKAMLAQQQAAPLTLRVLRVTGVVKTADAPSEEDWLAQVEANIDAYYNSEVAPALNAANAANADLAQFQAARDKLLTWESMRQRFDLQDERDTTVSQQLIDLTKRGLEKALQDCSANRNAAATAQALALVRQLALADADTDTTFGTVLDTCGRSTFDISVDWTQVHNSDYTSKPDTDADHAFTEKSQSYTKTSGKLHLSGSTPEITSVSFEQTASFEYACEIGASLCTPEKFSIAAQDSAPNVSQCGAYGFYGSYRVERWNLDARGHYAKPYLYVTFQNPPGCDAGSFVVAPHTGTRTNYDRNGNVSSTVPAPTSDLINTVPWSGGLNVGSTSRIIRRSNPLTGPGVVQPGSEERWTTSLTFTITEIVPN